jgi:hypothetical protein
MAASFIWILGIRLEKELVGYPNTESAFSKELGD